MEKGTQYRTLLIQAIHACATKFADVAERCALRRGRCRFVPLLSCVCGPAPSPADNWRMLWRDSRAHGFGSCCWYSRGALALA